MMVVVMMMKMLMVVIVVVVRMMKMMLLVVVVLVSECIYLARDLHDGDLGLLSDGMIGAPIDFSSSEGNGWVGWTRGQVIVASSLIIFDTVCHLKVTYTSVIYVVLCGKLD